MQFNSLVFLVFAVIFYAAWLVIRRWSNTRWLWLVIASMVFYGWWDYRFLALIVGSGLIDFFAGLAMKRFPARRKLWLILSIAGNVGSLVVFKYATFACHNINWLLAALGVETQVPIANVGLPVGISFYTFQSMSYTIDIYRGHLKPTRNFLHFFAYLSMFPQLVAGPIVRASDLLPQLKKAPRPTDSQLWGGLRLIAYGYFKKVVIADHFAVIVNKAFAGGDLLPSCPYWWIIMVLFAYQIYCDFSGYSDIARGLAKWMGYEFPRNFNHPYAATGFNDFWRRWHISLSTWFRDYVYIPLGGSRRSRARGLVNTWATMLISGLWHGASWTFVIWGALHSLYLTIERVTKWPQRLIGWLPRRVGRSLVQILVFLLVVVAWVFFRAQSFPQAFGILRIMFDFRLGDMPHSSTLVPSYIRLLLAGIMLRQIYFALELDRVRLLPRRVERVIMVVVVAALLAGAVFLRGPAGEFIYFQF